MLKYNQIYLGQDGNLLLKGLPDNFSKHFDWAVTMFNQHLPNVIKRNVMPKTIYVKIDFLPTFVNSVLPNIQTKFVLITGAGDYSPEVNFKREYNMLIKDARLKHWFMNNMRNFHEKCSSLPAGFAAGTFWDNSSTRNHKKTDEYFLKIREKYSQQEKIDKVFCSFRDRTQNDCGSDMVIRSKVLEVIKNDKSGIFDIYEPDSLGFEEFVDMISKYKYALIPHGNGMDPNPSMWIALNSSVTPVIWKTPNVIDMFRETDSVIFFDKPTDLTNKELYQDKGDIGFEFLTGEYWANKIKNKI